MKLTASDWPYLRTALKWWTLPALLTLTCGSMQSIWPQFGILFFLFSILIFFGWIGFMIVQLVDSFAEKNRVKIISILFILILVFSTTRTILRMGDYIHLALFYPYYHSAIKEWHGSSDHIVFDWGSSVGLLTSEYGTTLYYDRNDNLAKYVGTISTSEGNEMPGVSGETTDHLIGHFYVVRTWHL